MKAFFVYGGNPVGSVCDQKAILKGLMREDLFTVVHERFLTDTARYADILLPAVFSSVLTIRLCFAVVPRLNNAAGVSFAFPPLHNP